MAGMNIDGIRFFTLETARLTALPLGARGQSGAPVQRTVKMAKQQGQDVRRELA